LGTFGGKENVKRLYHAFTEADMEEGPQQALEGSNEIQKRQLDLYKRAMDENIKTKKLLYFGQYLHYLEDKWSHWGYTYGSGHAWPNILNTIGLGKTPDSASTRPAHYQFMVFDSMVSLGKLAKELGYNTNCEADFWQFHFNLSSTPKEWKDFQWSSPLELKKHVERVSNSLSEKEKEREMKKRALELDKKIKDHLKKWEKLGLIDEVIKNSKRTFNNPFSEEDKKVSDIAIKHLAKQLFMDAALVEKNHYFMHVPWEKDGTPTIVIDGSPVIFLKDLKLTQKSPNPMKIKEHVSNYYSDSSISGSLVLSNPSEMKLEAFSAEIAAFDISRENTPYVVEVKIPEISPGQDAGVEYFLDTDESIVGRPIVLLASLKSDYLPYQERTSITAINPSAEIDAYPVVPIPGNLSFTFDPQKLDSPTQTIEVTLSDNMGPSADFQATIRINGNEYSNLNEISSFGQGIPTSTLTFEIEKSYSDYILNPLIQLDLVGQTEEGYYFHYVLPGHLVIDDPKFKEPGKETKPSGKEKTPKGKGPKGVEQQGIITPSGNFLPPVKQMKMGLTVEEVLCNEGKELIFKSTDGSPKCVSMVAAEKLVERGWATR